MGQYTVVWTNEAKNIWTVSRCQNVADGEAAVIAIQLQAAGKVTPIAVFKGWPEQDDEWDEDDFDDYAPESAATGGENDEAK